MATREAEAAREVGALRAELAMLRSAAAPRNDPQVRGICTPTGEKDNVSTTGPSTSAPRDDGSLEAKKTDTRQENGDGLPSHVRGGSHGGEEGEHSTGVRSSSQSSVTVRFRLPVPGSVTRFLDDVAEPLVTLSSKASSPSSAEQWAARSETADGATSLAPLKVE